MEYSPNAQLALETVYQRPTTGIPTWMCHIMEHRVLEQFAGAEAGAYRQRPEEVYLAATRAIGTSMIDQYLPTNPLTMADEGYEDDEPRTATTGLHTIEHDGIRIDSPEAVVQHLEQYDFPRLEQFAAETDVDRLAGAILAGEEDIQQRLGPDILKCGHGAARFPYLYYGAYGYENYFMAYALFPEVMERHFALQARAARVQNEAVVRAWQQGDRPPLIRLDHDMADSRGTLVDIKSLDRSWFPHFAASIEPLLDAGIRLIWHCDGNLMDMVPRLLEAGLAGFQGFQYEDGMDYAKICNMRTRDDNSLIIIAGSSVTRTLPLGTPGEVKRELEFLVEHGPRTGLFLGASSSITPGTPLQNLQTLAEGLRYYREHGRD